MPGGKLSITLADDEIDAVLLGLRLAAQQEELGLIDAADAVTDRIDAALRRTKPVAEPPMDTANPIEHAIAAALAGNRKLRLVYADKQGRGTERVVWPVAVGLLPYAHTLGAWCELRRDFRHFRLDRIAEATQLPDPLPRHRRVLLAELLAQSDGAW